MPTDMPSVIPLGISFTNKGTIHSSSTVRDVARLTFVPGSLESKDLCGELVAGLGRAADASLREVNRALVLVRVTRFGLAVPNPVPVCPVGEWSMDRSVIPTPGMPWTVEWEDGKLWETGSWP